MPQGPSEGCLERATQEAAELLAERARGSREQRLAAATAALARDLRQERERTRKRDGGRGR